MSFGYFSRELRRFEILFLSYNGVKFRGYRGNFIQGSGIIAVMSYGEIEVDFDSMRSKSIRRQAFPLPAGFLCAIMQ